ncbi:MAG TPA: hypothetical protein VN855_00605 [Candidatus Acidoferrum sp.]|nr:hypothetical protein [Candidatus Acidoferrum sp.]
MAHEKHFTAKQAANAILEKVGDILKKSKVMKEKPLSKSELEVDFDAVSALLKGETENSKKLGYKLPEAGRNEKQPEKSDGAFQVEGKGHPSSNDPRLGTQPNPEKNPKEQAEGNNELAGTTPTQVGQDGKNKPGYDEMKSHLKLAKFIGRMDYKRTKSLSGAQSQSNAEAQHQQSIKNKV